MVPSVFIDTPVKPPSLLIAIVASSIFPSVAATPSAKSVPFPLSANTLAVVPPAAESIGLAVKSSLTASMFGSMTIVTSAVVQIVLSTSKQMVYSTV